MLLSTICITTGDKSMAAYYTCHKCTLHKKTEITLTGKEAL